MARTAKKGIDTKKLVKMLDEGKDFVEISNAFDVSPQTLKLTIAKINFEGNKAYKPAGMFGRSASDYVSYGKGGIKISVKQISDVYKVGDKFKVVFGKDKITLKKI